jgi:hypothetical protein
VSLFEALREGLELPTSAAAAWVRTNRSLRFLRPRRNKAASLSEDDPQRGTCLELAEGYERLAEQIERRAKL